MHSGPPYYGALTVVTQLNAHAYGSQGQQTKQPVIIAKMFIYKGVLSEGSPLYTKGFCLRAPLYTQRGSV